MTMRISEAYPYKTYFEKLRGAVMTAAKPIGGLAEEVLNTVIEADRLDELKHYFFERETIRNYYFADGDTLLHKAAQANAIACTTYLAGMYDDINAYSRYGSTPLENALANHAGQTAAYLSEQGGRAFITTFEDFINEEDSILPHDKPILITGLNFNEEYLSLMTDIHDYLKQLAHIGIQDNEGHELFFASIRLLMNDHMAKLNKLRVQRNQFDFALMIAVLDRYPLTRNQVKIFEQIYRNTAEIDKLVMVMKQLSSITARDDLDWEQLAELHEIIKAYEV